ncbi:MAG: pseudouridine synthase [Carbonactinosporaceae bacterium]
MTGGVRLQKVLAQAGIGSRRTCEELIAAGRVEVDGQRVDRLGMRVDPARAVIRVDERRVATQPGLAYLAFNKPAGVVSTMSDPQGRPCLGDYVRGRRERLFHVGRLDAETEGVILLTNDGSLAHRLAHPSYGVHKVYVAEVRGPVPRELGRRLRDGIAIDGRPVAVDRFRVVGRSGDRAMVEVVLHEGRKRIVRRLLDAAGHPVRRLVRTRFGPVALGSLPPGHTRELTQHEIGELFEVGAP